MVARSWREIEQREQMGIIVRQGLQMCLLLPFQAMSLESAYIHSDMVQSRAHRRRIAQGRPDLSCTHGSLLHGIFSIGRDTSRRAVA
jgi:hypothetical protein